MGKTKLGRRSRLFREFLGGIEPSELLIVALDISKFQPKAAIFEYFGDVVEEPFFFTPDYRGINQLCETARKALDNSGKQKIIFAVENTGHYHENITKLLEGNGQRVISINATTTHEERKAFLDYSKTDDLDLHAIAAAVSGVKVTFTELPDGLKEELRYLTRTRRFLIKERSKLVIVIRTILDHYWPYIQGIPDIIDGKTKIRKAFDDFTTSFFISFIKLVPSPNEALAMGEEGLLKLFQEKNLRIGRERILLILESAKLSRPISNTMLQHYVHHAKYHADGILRLNREIGRLEDRIEQLLCQTRGVFLLSMQQVNVISAAEFMAEIGLDLERYHSASAIIKLAGTNPVPVQSAGHNGQMCISKQGNPWLREAVTRIGKNLSEGCNPYFAAFTQHLSCRYGKQKRVAAGNKFIRVAYAMITRGELFEPKVWQGESLTINPLGKLKAKNIEMAQKVLNANLGIRIK